MIRLNANFSRGRCAVGAWTIEPCAISSLSLTVMGGPMVCELVNLEPAPRLESGRSVFATLGGTGLTGSILYAIFRLLRVTGWMEENTDVASDLASALSRELLSKLIE